MVDDLLSAFMSLSGSYVRATPLDAVGGLRVGYEIVARGQLEPALQEMAARMLPIWLVLVGRRPRWVGRGHCMHMREEADDQK